MVAPPEAPALALTPSSRLFSGALLPPPPRRRLAKRGIVALAGTPRAAAPSSSPLQQPLHPATRRRNSLRPKLLEILSSQSSQPVEKSPQDPVGGETGQAPVEEGVPEVVQHEPSLLNFPHDDHAASLSMEEKESALVLRQEVQEPNLSSPEAPVRRDIPRLLLEFSVYLLGFLAVQTVCAVWLFGGVTSGHGKNMKTSANATAEQVKGAGPEEGESETEFERAVALIRAMARDARTAEAREAAEKDEVSGLKGDIVDEVHRRLVKRTPRIYLDAKASPDKLVEANDESPRRAPAKGFSGSRGFNMDRAPTKGSDGSRSRASITHTKDLKNGGHQQIDNDGHFKKPQKLHAQTQPSGAADVSDSQVSKLKNSHTSGDLSTSGHQIVGKSREGLATGNGRSRKNLVIRESDEDSPQLNADEARSHKQTGSFKKASGVASKSNKIRTTNSESSLAEKHASSSVHSDDPAKSDTVLGKKTRRSMTKHLHEKDEDSQSDTSNKLWWLELPYLLAIFLHRSSDREKFKGLYSLKLDPSSEESYSYTVAFEDRADATNFCYLLESFFEDLEDFSADAVPMSIQELHKAVKSGALKVIVARKGQLRLYAGQPLAEAEVQLRTMLN